MMQRLRCRLVVGSVVVSALAGVASAQVEPGKPVQGPHYIVWSQHRASNGELWWRPELGPVTRAECIAALKKATGYPKVGLTKHYDIKTTRLKEVFGTVDTPDPGGTWLSCWPEGYIYGEPDE